MPRDPARVCVCARARLSVQGQVILGLCYTRTGLSLFSSHTSFCLSFALAFLLSRRRTLNKCFPKIKKIKNLLTLTAQTLKLTLCVWPLCNYPGKRKSSSFRLISCLNPWWCHVGRLYQVIPNNPSQVLALAFEKCRRCWKNICSSRKFTTKIFCK